MSHREKRSAQRFAVRLPVIFRNRDREIEAETLTVSRHGIFLSTPHLRISGELIQLQVRLPAELVTPPVTLKMMSVVAWALTAAEAEKVKREPGMGMKFFMVGATDKQQWDAFIEGLEKGTQLEAKTPAEPVKLPPPPPREGPVRFLIRARSLEQLREFGEKELAEGRMFLRTPLVRAVHELVELILIHPETKEEFPVLGQVSMVIPTGPVTHRGMGLEFQPSDDIHRRFERFVREGFLRLEGDNRRRQVG